MTTTRKPRRPKWARSADGLRAKWLAASADYAAVGRLLDSLRLGDRLARLFAVACAGKVARLAADPRCEAALDVAERFADGEATREELNIARDAARAAAGAAAWAAAWAAARDAARDAAWAAAWAAARDAARDAAWDAARDAAWDAAWAGHGDILVAAVSPGWAFAPAWRTTTSVALARRVYEAKEWDACPILADALQDAGCEEPLVLDYLRGGGPFFRGCRVVDEVLGKRDAGRGP